MRLPEDLHYREFSDWNYVVKGLVEVWDLASELGLEELVESHVMHDHDGTVTELLARIGNDCAALAGLVRGRSQGTKPRAVPALVFGICTAHQRAREAAPVAPSLSPIGAAGEQPPLALRRLSIPARGAAALAQASAMEACT